MIVVNLAILNALTVIMLFSGNIEAAKFMATGSLATCSIYVVLKWGCR